MSPTRRDLLQFLAAGVATLPALPVSAGEPESFAGTMMWYDRSTGTMLCAEIDCSLGTDDTTEAIIRAVPSNNQVEFSILTSTSPAVANHYRELLREMRR